MPRLSALTGTGDWVLNSGLVDHTGHRLDPTTVDQLARQAINAGVAPTAWFAAHGYLRWIEYQPADRFWTFQLIEAAIFTVLAAALLWIAVHLVRRVT